MPTIMMSLEFCGESNDVVPHPSPAIASGILSHIHNADFFLDAERYVEYHNRLPTQGGRFIVKSKLRGITPKKKGALVHTESIFMDESQQTTYVKVLTSFFAVGAKNLNIEGRGLPQVPAKPGSKPTAVIEAKIPENQHLIFRLSGDYNPLHIDPSFASDLGFPQPILHGLSTYGFCARELLDYFANGECLRILSLQGRFISPVRPGDSLILSAWKLEDGSIVFEALNQSSGKLAVTNGHMRLGSRGSRL